MAFRQKDGWVRNWFTWHFPSLCVKRETTSPNHSSHYCPDTIRLASEERVIVFTIPPNTKHLPRLEFSRLFGEAWMKKAMTSINTVSGFVVTGVYPVSRNVSYEGLGRHSKCYSGHSVVFETVSRINSNKSVMIAVIGVYLGLARRLDTVTSAIRCIQKWMDVQLD